MKEINTGGPAFPTEVWDYDEDGNGLSCSEGGMTLRDYFAAKAMQAYCSHSNSSDWKPHEIAEDAYAMADAMMKARDGKT